ncbi:serine hydrolase [Pseudoxanthomonas yeongjuensis]|nr:serine hydrolase domain-containing protein [Pseudoxanthomonas yeongjuensis]KAF1718733.1 serine hydrolase [Pseudoxanthomonas yeongjuensis]
MSSTAQTPLRWNPPPENTAGAARHPSPTQPQAYRANLADRRVLPLAQGFDVAAFENAANALTVGERVPGLAMAIVQNGRVLSARGYGVTDVSAPQQIDAHTVFRLASLSKAFAGTMTGLLVNDGSLRWDSKVHDYVPSFQLSDPGATQRVTVADLLSHRVGLHDHNAFDKDIEANAEYYNVARKLADAPLDCMPGQCYAYQNVAFSLIGDVVFAATGSFYDQAVDRRIFKPLGMNDASIGLSGIESSARWARPHIRSRNGWASLMPKPTYYRLPPAAGVNASASDMAQWLIAQTGHRPDVLPAPLLATLHAPLVRTPGEMRAGWRRERIESASYALGWRVFDYAGHQVVFHAGAVQGYRGLIALVPERDLGIAILWNSTSGLPTGLLPTMLDRAIGLPAQQWLDTPIGNDLLMADSTDGSDKDDSGAASDKAKAAPK